AAARGGIQPAALRCGAEALQGDRRRRGPRDQQRARRRGSDAAGGAREAEETLEPRAERRGRPARRHRARARHRVPRHHGEDAGRRGALSRAAGHRDRPGLRRQAMTSRHRAKPAAAPLSRLITETDPKSPASEAYRALPTNIQFAGVDQPCRSIVVTSASAGEGKTTSVANFGIVAAQAGTRVCLVDSDLRRPLLHRLFGLENASGLTTALVEDLPFADLAQPTRVPNLSVLPSGPLPPNPAELVGSKRMREGLQHAASKFDLVLCD